MFKLLLTGVWAAAITLGSVYVSLRHASAPIESSEDAARAAVQEYVPGELITVPVITNGAVQGYFLTKLSFAVDRTKINKLSVPLKESVTNTLFDILVGKNLINVADTTSFDLSSFKETVKKGLNEQMKDEVIFEVLIEQLEYLSKEDVKKLGKPSKDRSPPVPVVDRHGETAHDVIPGKEKEEAAAGH